MPGGLVIRGLRGVPPPCQGGCECPSPSVCLVDFYQDHEPRPTTPVRSIFACDAHRRGYIAQRGADQWARDCTTTPKETIYPPSVDPAPPCRVGRVQDAGRRRRHQPAVRGLRQHDVLHRHPRKNVGRRLEGRRRLLFVQVLKDKLRGPVFFFCCGQMRSEKGMSCDTRRRACVRATPRNVDAQLLPPRSFAALRLARARDTLIHVFEDDFVPTLSNLPVPILQLNKTLVASRCRFLLARG